MDAEDIIEVLSSSPEPWPSPPPGQRHAKCRQKSVPRARRGRTAGVRTTRPARTLTLSDEVIEISDSDDEPKVRKENAASAPAAAPVAGPSRTAGNARDGAPASPNPAEFWAADPFAPVAPLLDQHADGVGGLPDPFVLNPPVEVPVQLAPVPPSGNAPKPPVPPSAALIGAQSIHAPQEDTATPLPPVDIVEVQEEEDPISEFVARVLEIIPDVDPAHARALVEGQHAAYGGAAVERVLHALFENPDYPRADKKGKRKREDGQEGRKADLEDGPASARVRVDYGSTDRKSEGGEAYSDLALDQLVADFPLIPKGHIRITFSSCARLYAPTHLALRKQQAAPSPPYKPNVRPAHASKGKQRAQHDAELERERAWLARHLLEARAQDDARFAEAVNEMECAESGDAIECGCCFSSYPFDKMVQCPDAHLFCTECMTSYSETQLGSHDARLVCMDQSGCKLPFPESELRRFLNPKLLELYDRLKTSKEIEAAGLEGLEECPFCEYRCVIENPDEKLFRCARDQCGAVSCRGCKKLDHLPKSCKEMEEDKQLGAQHLIEEAMTHALMRNCPKCQKAFVKEGGCNKMTCPNCHTLSCYQCRKIITSYDHFNQAPPQQVAPQNGKCQLWDTNLNQQHANEVNEAAHRALADFRRDHPDEDPANFKLDIPAAAPVVGPLRPGGYPQVPPAMLPLPAVPRAHGHVHGRHGRGNVVLNPAVNIHLGGAGPLPGRLEQMQARMREVEEWMQQADRFQPYVQRPLAPPPPPPLQPPRNAARVEHDGRVAYVPPLVDRNGGFHYNINLAWNDAQRPAAARQAGPHGPGQLPLPPPPMGARRREGARGARRF